MFLTHTHTHALHSIVEWWGRNHENSNENESQVGVFNFYCYYKNKGLIQSNFSQQKWVRWT